VKHPSKILTVGQEVECVVLGIDQEAHRISLGLKQVESNPWQELADKYPVGARLKGKVERHEKFGVFVFLAPGRTGVIPSEETGVAKEGDVVRAFPVGADVEVVVLDVDPSGRRIRLSAKAVVVAHERAQLREYTERAGNAPEGFGSLADKLRGALKPREK